MIDLDTPYSVGLGEIFGPENEVGVTREVDVDILRDWTYRLSYIEQPEGKHDVRVSRVKSPGASETVIPLLAFKGTIDQEGLTEEHEGFIDNLPYPKTMEDFMREVLLMAKFIKTKRV